MEATDYMRAAASATKAVLAALDEKPYEAVAHALDAALAFIPPEDLQPYLTEAAIRRAKTIKAAGDFAKFGPDGSIREW